jgi:hypothetical protein
MVDLHNNNPEPSAEKKVGKKASRILAFAIISCVIGMSLVITASYWTSNINSDDFRFYGWLFLAIPGTYLVLAYLFAPAWKSSTKAQRQLLPSIAFLIGAIVSSGALAAHDEAPPWLAGVGAGIGSAAPRFDGTSWGVSYSDLVELHATDNPVRTDFGIWRALIVIPSAPIAQNKALRFALTQPDWAVLNDSTSDIAPSTDGVAVSFSALGPTGEELISRIDLDPHDSDTRRWHTVDIPIPADTQQLIITVEPKATVERDRLWISRATLVQISSWQAQVAEFVAVSFAALGVLTLAISARSLAFWSIVLAATARYGWLISGVVCLILGYLAVWQRGLVLDDHALKSLAIDPIGGHRQPLFDPENNPNYPARILTWIVLPQIAAFIPEHTLAARGMIAAMIGLNALLLGWLATRILHSRLAGTVTGWLFLFPILTEVPYWIGAGAYVIVTLLLLVSSHALWSVFTEQSHTFRWLGIAVGAFIISLLFAENGILLIILIPIIWITASVSADRLPIRSGLKRLSIALLLVTSSLIVVYTSLYTNSAVVRSRQGIDLSLTHLLDGTGIYFRALSLWTVQWDWGLRIFQEALVLSADVLRTSPWAALVTAVAVLVCFLTIISWRPENLHRHAQHRVALLMLLCGAMWFIVSLLFPYILARTQLFERRYLYIPSAGIALMIGALSWIIARFFRRQVIQQVVLGGASLLLLLTALISVGYCHVYAMRTIRDADQLSALARTVPASSLPIRTFLVPYNNDEQLFSQQMLVDQITIGQFESLWSTYYGLRLIYQREDIRPIVMNRWVPMQFDYRTSRRGSKLLFIQDRPVFRDRTLIYQYRNDIIHLVETVSFEDGDGSLVTIEFPIARQLISEGRASIPNITVRIESNP